MRQKTDKNIQDLNSDLDQANLINIYRTLHSKIDLKIGSKSLLSKCKGTEIITNSLSDHSAIKLDLRIQKLNSELHSFMETEQLALEC